jgi:hypothetical protein
MRNAKKIRETVLFESQMFLMFGLFWAMIMFLPMYLAKVFEKQEEHPFNLFMMCAPYLGYLVFRALAFLGRFFFKLYKISNQAKAPPTMKRGADEWMSFILLVGLWGAVMAWPLAINDFFVKPTKIPVAVLIIVGPYILYWLGRSFFQEPPPPSE